MNGAREGVDGSQRGCPRVKGTWLPSKIPQPFGETATALRAPGERE